MLTSSKIEKFIMSGLFFILLFVAIFSFSTNNKAEAQLICGPGMTLDYSANPPRCVETNFYNLTHPSVTVSPSATNPDSNGTYQPLALLPGLDTLDFSTDSCPLGNYLNIMIKIIIGLVAVIAMVMIVMGGLEYMTSELISSKESGKGKIINAIVGLLIALASYLILNTLNPNLLNLCLDGIPTATIKIQDYQIQGRLGGGKCEEATSGPCAQSNLSSFSNPAQASAICNGESGNGKYLASQLDKGYNDPFSFGLFQINIIAHGSQIGDGQICKNIFKVDPNPPGKQGNSVNDSSLGGCLERKEGICLKYAATVINRSRYNACKNFISQPSENIKYASKLQKSSGWGQWGFNKSCGF